MKFFFYGTLKRGHYNWKFLLQNTKGCEFIKEATSPDIFQLYDLGAYPCMTLGEQEVKGEVWTIDNDDVIDIIEQMERGAGYTPLQFRTKEKDVVWTWIWDEAAAKRFGTPIGEWPVKTNQSTRHESPVAHQRAVLASASPSERQTTALAH